MAEYGPLDAIRDQVRWVRRRRNVLAVQLALYPLAGAAAAIGAAVLPAALWLGPALFVLVLLLAVAGFGAAVPAALRRARRAWLSASAAALWTDRRARLEERVSTALAVGDRRSDALARLLVADAAARARLLRPERLVPRVVPWTAAAQAAGGLGLLAAVALLVPAPGHAPLVFMAEPSPRDPTRPAAPSPQAGRPLPASAGAARRMGPTPEVGGGGSREPLPAEGIFGMAAGLQQWLRETLHRRDDALAARSTRRAEPALRAARRDPGVPRREGVAEAGDPNTGRLEPSPDDGATDPGAARTVRPHPAHGAAAGTAGPGAGTGTDPQLYGPARRIDGRAGGRFELAVAARVYARPGDGPEAGEDDPTADEADTAPALAPSQRADTPTHRLIVPPSWHAVVRRLFAHDTDARHGDETP